MANDFNNIDVDFEVRTDECVFTHKKGLFGAGLLVSDRIAKQAKQAQIWELSERERKIIDRLGE
ncbi:hypothetical protein LU293_09425 [Moraxella nasovis]|uniref:hypothetical protein n=1 Tax=Moraxella nasovis TaxID=2904121 RepID=UPI001F61A587|nr:hypothetical protein [Moraxella nasovis]UNU73269.1 hypothetical protein LU293_09425 [Moraxella nasovis]